METLPGHEHLKVIKGAPVISSYQEKNLVTMFPVHDEEELAKLRQVLYLNTLGKKTYDENQS